MRYVSKIACELLGAEFYLVFLNHRKKVSILCWPFFQLELKLGRHDQNE